VPIFADPGSGCPATFSDLIEKTWRRLMSFQNDMSVTLSADYTAGGPSFTIAGVQAKAIQPGMMIAIDYEMFYVESYTSASDTTGTVYVQGAYAGSQPADHLNGTLVYLAPRFPRFDIAVAINDDLNDLSTPDAGLFWVPPAMQITYNPVFQGYDLGSALPTGLANSDLLDIIEIRYKIAPPTHNYPRIKGWEIMRNVPDTSVFPSGMGLVIRESGWPGLPLYISYKARFRPFANLTDCMTTWAGLPPSATDLLPLGAGIQLVLGREVKRNWTESQPDPRKAPEVPPGAVMNSVTGWAKIRQQRIDAEADRLSRLYPPRHRGW
jgi:hypothetical protein